MLGRSMIAFTAVCLSAACTVADYKQPVADLHTAVVSSIDTVNALDARLTKARNAQWREQISTRQFLLSARDGTCADGTKGCSLQIDFRDGQDPRRFPATTLIPRASAGLVSLRTYVARLKEIAEADTTAKVTTSAEAALGSAHKIENAVGGKGLVASFTPPMTAAIRWFVGQYEDYVKYRALAKATQEAHDEIVELVKLASILGKAAAAYEDGAALEAFQEAQKAFDEAERGSDLTSGHVDAYVAAAQSYDVVLKATAASPLAAFEEAHRKLKKHLNREDATTLADALVSITEFVDKAKDFKGVVDSFEKANKKPREVISGNN